jgi:hypothetical protein
MTPEKRDRTRRREVVLHNGVILRPCVEWTEFECSDLTKGSGLARSWGCARRNRGK